ncbi:MAG: serine/threonine-protein kinase [Jatrophihabitans sp.]|uniref:serine/threonine-protein kinase n=1 Tax=Jatrophihabitans sp. TaxID=1932789 RepID=UPI003912C07C
MPFKLRGYAVERLIGGGASGDVWRARAVGSGALVALKRIAITSETELARAHAEAALLRALDHPNLVRLHSLMDTQDAVVLVLDLAEGGSLADLLAPRGRITPGEVITAVAPVAAALAYLHGEGVVHSDVSAANVLFTGAGVPLLADVGVARLLGDDSQVGATPAYVDPTVAAGGVPGPPSDVFMLGGVALHALTGRPPWPDAQPAAALARAAAGELVDVRGELAHAGVPETMAEVVGRALAPDPQRRGTAADLALDLRHSGCPVAVEIGAGRARAEPQPVVRTGPRHAAPPAGEPPSAGRPTFARPTESGGVPGAAPPTRMVGPRPRPVIPQPPARRRPSPRLTAVLGAVLLAGAILAAGLVWAGAGSTPPADTADQVQPHGKVETSTGLSAQRSRPASAAAAWATRLAALDAIRARAFAQRDAGLLKQVYAPGPLLAADSALLSRIVPAGCGLAGARTTYSGLRAVPTNRGAVVTVNARLASSRLMCAGRLRGTAAGAGPAVLRLELVGTADGVRIAGQRPA